jgi:hypothetical protein
LVNGCAGPLLKSSFDAYIRRGDPCDHSFGGEAPVGIDAQRAGAFSYAKTTRF